MKPVLFITLLVLSSLSAFGQGDRFHDFTTVSKHTYDSTLQVYNYSLAEAFNKERSKQGLHALTYDDTRQATLNSKAIRMCKEVMKTGKCTHDKWYPGEIMMQSPETESPESAMKAWMNSPGHKAVILTERKDVKRICAGAYFTQDGSSYLVIRAY